MKKQKSGLTRNQYIVVLAVEVAIVVFCLIISIIVAATNTLDPTKNLQQNGSFIGSLQNNSTLFFCSILLPLIIIFVIDGLFAIYIAFRNSQTVKKEPAPAEKKVSSISEDEKARIIAEAKAEARKEMLEEQQKKEK